MNNDLIMLGHGGGGRLTSNLVHNLFLKNFRNPLLEPLHDSALLNLGPNNLSFTTDSYVVTPLFFPGGNIGSLAVHGTVNDLAMSGARPLYLSAAYILEEGFRLTELEKIVGAMAEAAWQAGVYIVTGDTKVVPRGMADGLYINTAGIGIHEELAPLGPQRIRKGDAILINGTIGDHGAAVITAREEGFSENSIISDAASLHHLVKKLQDNSIKLHCLRDATRGGAGGVLAELAEQAQVHLQITENAIPIKENVRGFCEIYGLEALFLANEGKMLIFCPEEEAERALQVLQQDALGREAAIIGRVCEENQTEGRLVMKTMIGGTRVIDQPSGDLVPRIC
ncbi:MAG: hydrogenase expression/formation protein HypE [Deltaproteobacteria bacterium]|nr:hydrogenase expression/formation protein HypE [Deltaproteobacteria bacterium]